MLGAFPARLETKADFPSGKKNLLRGGAFRGCVRTGKRNSRSLHYAPNPSKSRGFYDTAEAVPFVPCPFVHMTVLKYHLSGYRVIYTELFRG